MSEPTTVTHASGPRAGQPVAPGPDDAARRREWVAALRWAAGSRKLDELTRSAHHATADQIEAGQLTPWADQPEPAAQSAGLCIVDVPDQGGPGGWDACGRERPCPQHDQPATAPAEPSGAAPAVVRCGCGVPIVHATPDGYGRDGCDDPDPDGQIAQLNQAVADAEQRADAAEDRMVTASAERQWAANGWCRRCGNGLAAAELAPEPDPYCTWDPSQATDDPDGLPDRAIVPLVESLRARGIVTLQSCIGHLEEQADGSRAGHDGKLWVRADSVDGAHIRHFLLREPFDRVQLVFWPWRQWEFEWHPDHADAAVAALHDLLPATAEPAPEPARCDMQVERSGASWPCDQTLPCSEHPHVTAADVEPAPEPDSGPGWESGNIREAGRALRRCGEPALAGEVDALLADRDRLEALAATYEESTRRATVCNEELAAERDRSQRRVTDTAGRLVDEHLAYQHALDERDAARAELAEVQRQLRVTEKTRDEINRTATAAQQALMQRKAELAEVTADLSRTEEALAEVTADRERLRELVGEEGQPGWDGCSRAEAIRQTEAKVEALVKLSHDLDSVHERCLALEAELATARRDAAVGALEEARGFALMRAADEDILPERRRMHAEYANALGELAAEARAGTRPVPGSPQPAGGDAS